MKLVRKNVDSGTGEGFASLVAEDTEDLWHVYNIIRVGDQVTASTFRRVQKESTTGSVDSERKKITLTIEVLAIEYDAGAGSIRVGGTNMQESPYVRMGSYHTLELALQRKFSIAKHEWDSISLERLETACDPRKTADLGAILMQEGLANLCLNDNISDLQDPSYHPTQEERRFLSRQGKGMSKFFEALLDAVLRSFNFEVIKCILVASPGFLKDEFHTFMMQEMVRRDIKLLQENKTKFFKCPSHSGHKRALRDILGNPDITKQLENVKATGEVFSLNRFYDILREDTGRAIYSYKLVSLANQNQAIETLLISEDLFRSFDVAERKKYVQLVEDIRDNGGEVLFFSSLHVSGEQLNQLTGIAAILRFPMPDLDEMEDSEDDFDETEYFEEYCPGG